VPGLPTVTARETIAAFRRAGWSVIGQTGSHAKLGHPSTAARVTVPMHRGDIKSGTLKSILKQAGMTVDEFLALL
jgi:predicted RNA binding protein YcfA (HicA-like mRNA interferase family)